jgi:hypothetical protein
MTIQPQPQRMLNLSVLCLFLAVLPACANEGDDASKVNLVETPRDGAVDGAREVGATDAASDETDASADTGASIDTSVDDTGALADTGASIDTGTSIDTGSPAETGTGPETFVFPTTTDTEKLKITPRFGDPTDVYEGTRTTKLLKIKTVTIAPVLQNWTFCATALLTFDVYVNDVKLGTMAVPPGSTTTPGAEVSLAQTFSGLSIASLIGKVTVRFTNPTIVGGCGTVVVVKGKGKVTLE